jgi:hypothetical protein
LNPNRAASAAAVVLEYRRITGADDDDPDVLSDLLADLMHWSDANGIKFSREEWNAQICHATECGLEAGPGMAQTGSPGESADPD